MTIYLRDNQLEDYIEKYTQRLIEQDLTEEEIQLRLKSHLSTNVVIKYSKEWQDARFNELLHLIMEVPGGYWQVQELMNGPHVEYQYYKHINRRSYEKGNVTDLMAKKELNPRNFMIYKTFNKSKQEKNGETTEIEIDYEVEGKIVN